MFDPILMVKGDDSHIDNNDEKNFTFKCMTSVYLVWSTESKGYASNSLCIMVSPKSYI